MIHFIVAPGHSYTFKPLIDPAAIVRPLPVKRWNYHQLFARTRVARGTWVFCDLERLAVWELQLAGEYARLMREAGLRVLNDPARAACRYELLLRLHDAGFNRFRAWRAEDGIPPARFPVFLRIESDHHMPLSRLIETPEALDATLARLADLGISRRGVLIIEYEAEEYAPGVWRKYAVYRIGDRIVPDHIVHDVTWLAKYGNPKAWSEKPFAEEAEFLRDNPHEDALRRAFEIARIDYGRADYGLVGGVPQIWEINTNPQLSAPDLDKLAPERAPAHLAIRDVRLEALAALDTPADGDPVAMVSPLLDAHRNRQRPGRPELIRA
ncbi:MAG TPA: hypothetical protein VJ859_16550 [Allosphingosinicella sp.]|nr:hypothetical protein [Allosphingosinicella sp.]